MAVEHAVDAVGTLFHLRVVADQHHRRAVALTDREEQVEQPFGGCRVKRAGRLVGKQQPRLVDKRARDRNALALPAGELLRAMLRPIAESDLLEQGQRASSALAAGNAGSDQRHFDVCASGEHRQEQVVLEDEAHELAAVLGDVALAPHRAGVDQYLALIGGLKPADQVQQGALARARAPGYPDELARGNAQVNLGYSANLTVVLAYALKAHLRTTTAAGSCSARAHTPIIAGDYPRAVLALARVNIRGRLGRSALSALGVACGVSTVVALLALTGGLNSSAGDLAHLGRADFGVFQGGLSDLTASTLPNATIARVARLPGVAAATPIEILAGAIAGEPETLVFGAQSESFLAHRLVIIAGRRFGANEAMVGKGAASILHVAPGQSITVDGDQLPIAGIYSSGIPLEDSGVVVPLALARRLSGRSETISMIAVSIAPGYSEAHVRAQVQRALPGTVAIGAPGELERVDTNSRIIHEAAIIVALLALALGAAVVLNTAALAVVERRSELAVLQALGWSRLRICALLASESLLTSAAGVLLGLGLGVAAAELAVQALAIAVFLAPQLSAPIFLEGIVVGFALGLLGALFAAWRVLRAPLRSSLGRA
jgi:putative ABC transport system permease protein